MDQDVSATDKRIKDLWFPTASLIIRAENSLFRVHSDVLGARSSVFRDMIAFPQPASPEGDIIDGHCVVALHDAAAEVEVFLRAIFDSSFFMPSPSPTDFPTVIGVIRLAHKYDVQYLFRRALSHLSSLYPMDLHRVLEGFSNHHVDFPYGVVTDLITLRAALEVGATWLLPAVYYNICSFPAKTIFAAGKHWEALNVSQQQLCLTSQVELLRATALMHGQLIYGDGDHCNKRQSCERARSEARAILLGWSKDGDDLDPLQSWAFYGIDGALCNECERAGEKVYDIEQTKFWNRLPEIFGLSTWDDLKEEQREAIKEVQL
ncbi:hypothetical protein C8R43DRAFT_881997 [Mycena crocata]|nr:hypothetical protein C8R43DRAFT_881997 [Mycena crocata]